MKSWNVCNLVFIIKLQKSWRNSQLSFLIIQIYFLIIIILFGTISNRLYKFWCIKKMYQLMADRTKGFEIRAFKNIFLLVQLLKSSWQKVYLRFGIAILGANGQILCHFTRLDCRNTDLLECITELLQVRVIVHFCAMNQTTGPGKDWR